MLKCEILFSNSDRIVKFMGGSLRDMTYQLIAEQSNYAPFSNTGYTDGRGGSYNSLENIHNGIHDLVGQNGHMGIISFSAFDPIFWPHHALSSNSHHLKNNRLTSLRSNVDRLFAIWQAIYPDSYTTPEVNAEGTFTDAPGSTEDTNTRKHTNPLPSSANPPRKRRRCQPTSALDLSILSPPISALVLLILTNKTAHSPNTLPHLHPQ